MIKILLYCQTQNMVTLLSVDYVKHGNTIHFYPSNDFCALYQVKDYLASMCIRAGYIQDMFLHTAIIQTFIMQALKFYCVLISPTCPIEDSISNFNCIFESCCHINTRVRFRLELNPEVNFNISYVCSRYIYPWINSNYHIYFCNGQYL